MMLTMHHLMHHLMVLAAAVHSLPVPLEGLGGHHQQEQEQQGQQ